MNIQRTTYGLAAGALLTGLAAVGTYAATTTAKPHAARPAAAKALTAPQLLQATMRRYAALNSLRAHAIWTFDIVDKDGKPQTETQSRTLIYARPNRFRVIAGSPRLTFTTVSDGKKIVEYTTSKQLPARENPAPASLARSSAMSLQHFMFGGTPLFSFFGGPGAMPKTPVTFGADVVVGGTVPCRVVAFDGGGMFGHTQVAIGRADGLVHRISYDAAPLIAVTANQPNAPRSLRISELYDSVKPNAPVTQADFATALPPGISTAAAPDPAEPKPPVPIGAPAPDFSVTPVAGGAPVKLSAMKGQVVMLDFWATWCPPCRKSLPETQRLNATYGGKGLTVLAISDEAAETVTPFLTGNKYTFPTFLDTTKEAGRAFGVQAIPTFAIIDTQGNLAAYFVGLQEDGVIEAAIKKAGLKTG